MHRSHIGNHSEPDMGIFKNKSPIEKIIKEFKVRFRCLFFQKEMNRYLGNDYALVHIFFY